MIFVSAPAVGAEVPTADEIAEVEQQIKDADMDANLNTPRNRTMKGREDRLDKAQRDKNNTPENAPDAVKKARDEAVKKATEDADSVRENSTNEEDKERAKNYRKALEKIREAHKQMKKWQQALARAIQQTRQAGVTAPGAERELVQLKRKVDTGVRQTEPKVDTASTPASTKGAQAPQTVTKGAHETAASFAKSKTSPKTYQPTGYRPDGALH
jgi:hypothetical protein